MKILEPGLDIDSFFAEISSARRRALLLDYDGTLAPFRAERDEAIPYPGIQEILASILFDNMCRLVLVSGRSIDDLIPLTGLERLPEIWGGHGWERRMPDGSLLLPEPAGTVLEGLERAHAFALDGGLANLLETKRASLAMHLRGIERGAIENALAAVEAEWQIIAKTCGLELHEFDGGFELCAPGRDKGSAVVTVLGESGVGTAAAYCGDDRTDENAFRAMKGRGMSVLVGETFRETAADLWLKPPGDLIDFLERWHRACRRKP